ncbi:lysozyme g-like isoform X2 [Chelmon rostratus]|uniref:lysozyme g-like isoform X2 n=1 Tax=Chelmon rostratus TaxID=109905 RepID=UPI001BEADF74|nr:lysozyme g-like isoform X2 [Chelmon rostratus]
MDYGNIRAVETTGASWQTSQQDRLGYSGETASHTMAETDAGRMERESRAGNALTDGWGDYSPKRGAWNAWGLMQVDVNPEGGNHTPVGEWDSEDHLCQATKILVDFIKLIQSKPEFSGLSKEKQLKGGIAAYNAGDRKVHSYEGVDENTTGKDYSNDVVARAQWYKKNGGF